MRRNNTENYQNECKYSPSFLPSGSSSQQREKDRGELLQVFFNNLNIHLILMIILLPQMQGAQLE